MAWLRSSYDRLFHAFDIARPRPLSVITSRGTAKDTARRQLADAVLLLEGDNQSAGELAEAAPEKFGI